jgi:predicted dehydrogenase
MKKKIGFIDLFIDEWHANNFPGFIRASALSDKFELALAWEEAPAGGKPLAQWCAEMGMTPASSLQQVVEQCDVLCVLAPSNSEVHERLADLPLRSGKPVYVDKPFAPDKAAAKRMFDLAASHGTPLMSCSALRYDSALTQARQGVLAGREISFVSAIGGGRQLAEYAIHQVEMIVALMGCGAQRVQAQRAGESVHVIIEYPSSRRATLTYHPALPFGLPVICHGDAALELNNLADFFPHMIDAILGFFDSGKAPIPAEETIEISAIVESLIKSESLQGAWVNIPS